MRNSAKSLNFKDDRRVVKEVYTSGGSLDHTLDMYYNENWQILEVRKDGNADPLKQYVWHAYYIDAPAIRYYDPDTDGSSIATQYFTHDANMNVTALIDDTGAVIERYDYTAYGQVTVLNPDFTDDADGVSDYEQNVLFAGYQYDAESGMHHVRHRNHHPALGRWIQRDPLEYVDGQSVYEYVRSYPTFALDPLGTTVKACTSWRERVQLKFPRLKLWIASIEFSGDFLAEGTACAVCCDDGRIVSQFSTSIRGRGSFRIGSRQDKGTVITTPWGPMRVKPYARGMYGKTGGYRWGGCDDATKKGDVCTQIRGSAGAEGCYEIGIARACIRGEVFYNQLSCESGRVSNCVGGRVMVRGCVGIGWFERCKEWVVVDLGKC